MFKLIVIVIQLSLFNLINCQNHSYLNDDALRVVSIYNEPFFVKNNDGNYEGFIIDLLEEITKPIGLEYDIYISPDLKYGHEGPEGWNGMIGELVNKKADLAVGNLVISEQRKKAVDFTEPFLPSGITGLLSKQLANQIRKATDLINQTKISYGTLSFGPTYTKFMQSTDPMIRPISEHMKEHPEDMVLSNKEGIIKVLSEDYVFFGETERLEYLASQICSLTVFKSGLFQINGFGIAMQKNSHLLPAFNKAIFKMKLNGKLKQLKEKWWRTSC